MKHPLTPLPRRTGGSAHSVRRDELVSIALIVVLALVTGWALITGFLVREEIQGASRSGAARGVVERLEDRVEEVVDGWFELESGLTPPGLLRPEPMSRIGGWREDIEQTRLSPQANRMFQLALVQADSVTIHGREGILLRIEARGAHSLGREAEAADLIARAEVEERRCRSLYDRFRRTAEALKKNLTWDQHRLQSAVWSFFGLTGVLACFCLAVLLRLKAAHRDLAKSLHGALLVEEMLESYSRRLESMNEALEHANILKLQLLQRTWAELKPPLDAMQDRIRLLRQGEAHSPEVAAGWVDELGETIEKLQSRVAGMVDLCTLEDGRVSLKARVAEAGPLIERLVSRYRLSIETHGLAFLVIPPAEGWPRLLVDPERVTQVLQNLIENAARATEQGSIRLTGRVLRDPAPMLRIEVADTGAGIDPGEIPRLFENFIFRETAGASPRGLGLTLGRQLVRAMGGEIGLESEGRGQGARAWIQLPIAAASSSEASGQKAA